MKDLLSIVTINIFARTNQKCKRGPILRVLSAFPLAYRGCMAFGTKLTSVYLSARLHTNYIVPRLICQTCCAIDEREQCGSCGAAFDKVTKDGSAPKRLDVQKLTGQLGIDRGPPGHLPKPARRFTNDPSSQPVRAFRTGTHENNPPGTP